MPAKPRKPNRPASVTQAAAYASCSRRTMQRYIYDGRIPAYRFGPKSLSVDLDDVDRLFRLLPTAAAANAS